MIDIEQIKFSQLSGPGIYSQIEELVDEYSFGSMMGEALDSLRTLEKLLSENKELERRKPELANRYKNLVIKLKFICLPLLADQEVQKLLIGNLLSVFDFNINLNNKLDLYLTLHRDDYTGDELKIKIASALAANKQRLGRDRIAKKGGRAAEPPFISNWLKDFLQESPQDMPLGNLEEVKYLNQNINVAKLTVEEKQKLTKIIKLYNTLRFSRLSLGIKPPTEVLDRVPPLLPGEEEEEKKEIIKRPIFEKQEMPVRPLDRLKQKYQEYRIQRQHVLKLEDKILVKTQGEVENVKKELAVASRQGDKERVIACLKIIAGQKKLTDSLKENPAWFEAVSEYISKKYGPQYKPAEIRFAISNLKIDPTTPIAVSEFLQYLLKEKLKMNENDSALVGVEIGQLLGDQYQGLAYGNEETGSFEWTKNKIEDQKLISNV